MKKMTLTPDEMIGMKFGKLTVNGMWFPRKKGHMMLDCSCDCGTNIEARQSDVARGHTQSCGCIVRKKHKKIDLRKDAKKSVIWNSERHKFAAYANGELLGYFYEETIAEMVVNKANRGVAA